MKNLGKLASAAAIGAFALVGFGATSASAAAIVSALFCNTACGPGGTFVDGSVGTVTDFLADKTDTYDFTFTMGPTSNPSLMQLAAAITKHGQPVHLPVAFDLYSGTPNGGGTFLQTTAPTQVNATMSLTLAPGDYYMELTPGYTDKRNELISGGLAIGGSGGVPEPASWSMMIVGVALLGAGLRIKGRSGASVLAA
jgi:hypothetical protein